MENRIEYKLMKVASALLQKDVSEIEEAIGANATLEEILDYVAKEYKLQAAAVVKEKKAK